MKIIGRKIRNLFIHVLEIKSTPTKDGFILTYEGNVVRQNELKKIMFDALPHFCLTPDEFNEYKEDGNIGDMVRISLSRLSAVNKNTKGDYGELLLYLITMAYYKTKRFVTKVKLRSSRKDQIKGYDCAHFTYENNELVLWLGEVKFYKNFSSALKDISREIEEHTSLDYLKGEFSILVPNIEINRQSPEYTELHNALSGEISLDDVRIKIPALITYDSPMYDKHTNHKDIALIEGFKRELTAKSNLINKRKIKTPRNVDMVFIIIPLHNIGSLKTGLEAIEAALA